MIVVPQISSWCTKGIFFFERNYLGYNSIGGVNRTDLWTGMLDLQRYILLNETLLLLKMVAFNL